MKKQFFRVEFMDKFAGHFLDKSFESLDDAVKYREEIKGRENVPYWNEVYANTRIVKVTEIIEEVEL